MLFVTTAKSMVVIDKHNDADHNKTEGKKAASEISSKDAKKAETQANSEVIIRQLGNILIFTAPQPKTKMCAASQYAPDPEMLNNPTIRLWYEIDNGELEAPHNEVLWNLVVAAEEYFEQNVFPGFKNKMHKILIAFDIDETTLTYYEFYYKLYTTRHSENEYYALLESTRNCGANQSILSLYNFFKKHGCTVVFTSSRPATITLSEGRHTINLQPLVCDGLKGAGYDVEEKDVHLCSGFFKKEKRAELIQQNGYEFIVAIDDDFSVFDEAAFDEKDKLHCGILVPSAYRYDDDWSETYYSWLKHLSPDPTKPISTNRNDPEKLDMHMF
jgi:hypothetical protein